ncbi:tagatose-1,6-bisphosphate aldolase [Paenibacillus forsythiae]|uniref:Tagatose-1,6-bisphosphate aldolase n=1 Tax=Paenibacillus forsythiae TaxID=365616 RepID=A0ABU3H5S8_9BACL|nr:tagatose-1,6-bisphosphate aldolase [Paenibacillus forsythiae]
MFSQNEASEFYRRNSEKSRIPFIYLSGGVTNEQFIDTLKFAKNAGSTFCGVLCGRATWNDGVKPFAEQGDNAFREWLQKDGLANLERLKNVLQETATPWI